MLRWPAPFAAPGLDVTVTVTVACAADAAELARVAAATFPLACPPSAAPADVGAFITENLSAERFAGYLADPQRRVFAARDDAAIIGYAMLVRGSDSAVELSKMYVLPGRHGTGASAALMSAALAWAVEIGAARVRLGVNRNNERAQRFYAKHGFVVTGERTFTLGAATEHDFVMTRPMYDELYAYPDSGRFTLRANMIASIDGAATVGDTSGGLGGTGDRELFAVLRELADVIVVGAGTARAENYGGVRISAAGRDRRRGRGQAEVPPIALVTRSADLERDLPVFTGSEVPPLVLTSAAAAPRARGRLGPTAEVLDCSTADPDQVDLAAALQRLSERGLTRVLTEGGPSLLGSFIAHDLLDELCLTTAPLLVGGTAPRVITDSPEALIPMHRAHLRADDDGYLYARYVRA